MTTKQLCGFLDRESKGSRSYIIINMAESVQESNKCYTFAFAKELFDVMSAECRNQNGCQIITSILGNLRKTR